MPSYQKAGMESQKSSLIDQNPLTEQLKEKARNFYELINRELDSKLFGTYSIFLNYGYVSDGSLEFSKIDLPKNSLGRNSVKLILEVIGDCDISDSTVLDIGCGRGGNAHTIQKYFPVKEVTGLDLSGKAISFCLENYKTEPHLHFLQGDAENLPFEEGAFDVITNIESSHCYPNLFTFYAEVCRVLRPGGYFLYTDAFSPEMIGPCLNFLQELGFVLELERDITANVLLSLEGTASRHLEAFERDEAIFKNFLAFPGSQVWEDLRSRRLIYKIFRLKKGKIKKTALSGDQIEQPFNPMAKFLIQEEAARSDLQNQAGERSKKRKEAMNRQKQRMQERRQNQ